jgi:hypothetical protein
MLALSVIGYKYNLIEIDKLYIHYKHVVILKQEIKKSTDAFTRYM